MLVQLQRHVCVCIYTYITADNSALWSPESLPTDSPYIASVSIAV
jgi:hypothetical protein